MQDLPLVSIIIASFNASQVVSQAVNSALDQTYSNCEIVVIDDGSTDNTEDVLKALYKDKIIYVRQENKGPGAARNCGIRCASGKYIQFLDADDLLDSEKISIQIEMIKHIQSPALSYCDYMSCYMDGSPIGFERLSPKLQDADPFSDLMMKWETDLSIPIHCFLFDRVFFNKYGIAFDETLPSNEDWACWMDIFALHPKVLYADKVLAFYRVSADSRCRDRIRMRSGYLSAIEKQLRKHGRDRSKAEKLQMRKREIKYLYRDVSPIMRLLSKCPQPVKELYTEYMPWRIQRLFD